MVSHNTWEVRTTKDRNLWERELEKHLLMTVFVLVWWCITGNSTGTLENGHESSQEGEQESKSLNDDTSMEVEKGIESRG